MDVDEIHHIIFEAPENTENVSDSSYKESSFYSSRDSIGARSS